MDLPAWWRTMRPRCSPLSVSAPVTFAEMRARIAAALAWVAPADRLVFPPLFEPYLAQLANTTWYGHHVALDFLLYSPGSIAANAERDTPERHDDHDVARKAGLWIAIGSVGDKHEYYLCVDRDRGACGAVFDAHDNHPYLDTMYLSSLGMFEDWLADVASTPRDKGGGHLIALTAEERVLLDPLHDDPHALLVAARDLEYALVPDTAWAHAKGAPARVLYLAKPPAILDKLAMVREADRAAVAFVPPDALARLQEAAYAIGGYDDNGKFGYIQDASPQLRALASSPGGLLYVS